MSRQNSSNQRQVETHHLTRAHAYGVERSVWEFDTLCLLPLGWSQSWSKQCVWVWVCLRLYPTLCGVCVCVSLSLCNAVSVSVCAHTCTHLLCTVIKIRFGRNEEWIMKMCENAHKHTHTQKHTHTWGWIAIVIRRLAGGRTGVEEKQMMDDE